MLIAANTQRPDVVKACNPDVVFAHVHDSAGIAGVKTFGRAAGIDDDGTIADPHFPIKIGGKNGLGWGSTPALYAEMQRRAFARGLAMLGWSMHGWGSGWLSRRVGWQRPGHPDTSALSPYESAYPDDGDATLRLIRMIHVPERLAFVKLDRGRRLAKEGTVSAKAGKWRWNGRPIKRWYGLSLPHLVADPLVDLEAIIVGLFDHVGFRMHRVFLQDHFSAFRWQRQQARAGLLPWKRRPDGSYDLDRFDEDFFDRLTTAVSLTWRHGQCLVLSLPPERFQSEQLDGQLARVGWRINPYRQVVGDRMVGSYPRDLYRTDGEIGELHRALLLRVARAVREADGGGANVVLEICNEPDYFRPDPGAPKYHAFAAKILRQAFAGGSTSPVPDVPAPPSGPPAQRPPTRPQGQDRAPDWETAGTMLKRLSINVPGRDLQKARRQAHRLLVALGGEP